MSQLQSIDQVQVGQWLMCVLGPLLAPRKQSSMLDMLYGTRQPADGERARGWEGAIVRVLAVQAPMMLVEAYPVPCGDASHKHEPFTIVVPFGEMGWSTVNPRFRREYIKALKLKTKPLRSSVEVVSDKLAPRRLRDLFPPDVDYDADEDDDDDEEEN